MTEEEKQFNQWFDKYANGVKVFEEADMKQAYLQGRATLEKDFRICEKNADAYYDNLTRATEIIEGLMRFCRCFAQHHTEDIRYKDAEQFLNEVEK